MRQDETCVKMPIADKMQMRIDVFDEQRRSGATAKNLAGNFVPQLRACKVNGCFALEWRYELLQPFARHSPISDFWSEELMQFCKGTQRMNDGTATRNRAAVSRDQR